MVGSMKQLTRIFLAALCGLMAARAEDAAKPVVPAAQVLFDGKSMADWENVDIGGSGTVELEDGALVIPQGESLSGVVYKKSAALPVESYELTLEAQRRKGVDFFVGLTFPVRDAKTHLTLVMGGWGGSVTGISSIDGLDASENSTGSFQRYKDNQWYKVKLRVTPKEIRVSVDGKELINAEVEGKKLGLRAGPMESYAGLSLTTYQTEAAIKNVVLTPLPAEKKP